LFSFDVNLHYLFPQTNTPKFTPYVLGGIGYLRASASATVAGSTIDASASDTGLNIGGGSPMASRLALGTQAGDQGSDCGQQQRSIRGQHLPPLILTSSDAQASPLLF
jgi:hypothetical protein